ncbi:MAG: heme-binding protein [Spirochaetales bacterium]|nr:heme-binding protein [Spirochaetales bacterium]
MYTTNNLSHSEAAEIIEMIRTRVEAYGKGASIAVVDSHGELLAFLRTDNCRPSVINISINKAYTAARECNESGNIGRAAREFDFPITNFGDLRYTGWDGGYPIIFDGRVIGGVGVSGLPDEVDMELAKAGAELFSKI